MNTAKNTILIKNKIKTLGFESCGIARVEALYEDRKRLEMWLSKGFHGAMSYMEKYIEQRTNPQLLVDNAQSVVVVTLNYFPTENYEYKKTKISKYAWGEDYHEIIKGKLRELLFFIKENIGDINGRGFVDSAPVFEKTWAVKSGIGWIGKNGNLIRKKTGSFFFIATLIIDIPLEYDIPFMQDYCGSCNACIEACPTNAILINKQIEARKCISYYTIELKKELKEKTQFYTQDWIFGCDICQDVCPWNRFATPTNEVHLKRINQVINFEIADWLNLNATQFKKLLKNSPIKRAKLEGMQLNVKNVLKK